MPNLKRHLLIYLLLLLVAFSCTRGTEYSTYENVQTELDNHITPLSFEARNEKVAKKCDSILNSYDFKSIDTFDFSFYMELYQFNIECGKEFAARFDKHHSDYYPEIKYLTCDTLRYIDLQKISKSEVIEVYRNLLYSQNDNCPLELLDSLKKYQELSHELIDTLILHVDGYASEYFCELFPEKCKGLQPQ